ncbi:MAG: endo-1,4-beta-xylanase [Kiritimatiellia bacterium]
MILLACLSVLHVAAEGNLNPPSGGVPLLGADPLARLRARGEGPQAGSAVRVAATGAPSGEVWRLTTLRPPQSPWNLQLVATTTAPVRKGDTLWLRFFLRAVESHAETGEARIAAVFENVGGAFEKSLDEGVGAGGDWKEFAFSFESRHDLDPGAGQIAFRLGFEPQVCEVAGLELLNFGRVERGSLPQTLRGYPGCEPDAAWRKEALARIESIRKGAIMIEVRDDQGRPAPGVPVRVEMKRHAFGFGSAVVAGMITGESDDTRRYREIIERNFSKVVFENDLKWPPWESREPGRRRTVLAAIDWLRERGIAIRGHTLIWPGWRNTPRDLAALQDRPDELRARIRGHFEDEIGATRGRIDDWDVINEPFANHDVMRVLGDGVMADWFRLVRELDPKPRLFLNDYAGLVAGGRNTPHQGSFEKTLRFLKEQGAPLGSVGIQAHFGQQLTPPDLLIQELDRWAAFGLPVHITEFDLDLRDEELQAGYTRDFLTAMFSHPAVSAVLTWGFWESRHWRPTPRCGVGTGR